jgi:hypothetical protein
VKVRPAQSSGACESHTPGMSLKNAALLALVSTILLTALLLVYLVRDIWGVLNGVVPASGLLASLIYVLAALGMAVFFWVFHKAE